MNVIENIHAKILDSTETFYDVSVCIITYNKANIYVLQWKAC